MRLFERDVYDRCKGVPISLWLECVWYLRDVNAVDVRVWIVPEDYTIGGFVQRRQVATIAVPWSSNLHRTCRANIFVVVSVFNSFLKAKAISHDHSLVTASSDN